MATDSVFRLDDRVALITGAGSPTGIGFTTARFLGRMGATVFLTGASDRVADREAELRADGITAFSFAADLTVDAEVDGLVERVVAVAGRIDIVVNNAGMTSVAKPMEASGETGSVADMTRAEWDASLTRNLTTAFLVSKAALPALRASGHGRVISVASVTGPLMAMANDASYAASKAGMVGLMRSLAIDEAAAGITANTVAPGWIATGSQTPHEARQVHTVPVITDCP